MRWPWQRRPSPADARRMHCLRVALRLQRYLDGEVDEVTARRIAAHLEECGKCGMEAETYRQVKEALARGEPPSDDALGRVRGFAEALARGDLPAAREDGPGEDRERGERE